eukprot:TRINITY_DN10264_c0_g1_i2.p1 TRINITY_DN10264_c0_g1~~TRINITY_DN10264_c0_g1_i2.p1  ORF type:complete len:360 (-),score=21.62 TRINITY_DN10264_c0_g1_i2:23-1102(-)
MEESQQQATVLTQEQGQGQGQAQKHALELSGFRGIERQDQFPRSVGVLVVDELDDEPSVAVFWLVLISMLSVQLGLLFWKKYHKKSYDMVSMLGWWLFPAALAFWVGLWLFVLIWFAYSFMTCYILARCMKSKLDANTPWMVYSWFLIGHRICTTMGTIGYIGLISFWFVGFIPFPGLVLQCLCYGIYFGVLSRDCAVFATETMATTMGTGESLVRSSYTCGICLQSLGTDPRATTESNGDNTTQTEDKKPVSDIMRLPCKHEFHSLCLYGWTMVGKKDMCPLCKEKVSSTVFMKGRPWEGATVAWGSFLDLMRYFVVWYPLLFIGLGVVIHVFKLDVHQHIIRHVYNVESDGTLQQVE